MSATPPPVRPHNPVYETLVVDDDLVGMIAYAIYKKAKREWVLTANPTPDEQARYYNMITPTQLDLYRSKAEAKLATFANEAINESANEYRREGADSAIVAEVKRQQNMWVNLGVNVLGSIVFSVLLFVLAVVLFTPGFKEFAGKVFSN